jgi:hypothetical protein
MSVLCNCLFNIFAATLHICRPSPQSTTYSTRKKCLNNGSRGSTELQVSHNPCIRDKPKLLPKPLTPFNRCPTTTIQAHASQSYLSLSHHAIISTGKISTPTAQRAGSSFWFYLFVRMIKLPVVNSWGTTVTSHTQNFIQLPAVKVNCICRGNHWGSSVSILMQQVKYWSYILHLSNTWENMRIFIDFKKAYNSGLV